MEQLMTEKEAIVALGSKLFSNTNSNIPQEERLREALRLVGRQGLTEELMRILLRELRKILAVDHFSPAYINVLREEIASTGVLIQLMSGACPDDMRQLAWIMVNLSGLPGETVWFMCEQYGLLEGVLWGVQQYTGLLADARRRYEDMIVVGPVMDMMSEEIRKQSILMKIIEDLLWSLINALIDDK
mmetsp:Transcript_8241/g.6140  ORF Transcript_8241/g.6140 Transcript_8241/m.6140 type:complete len:187 (+) Transcript_8241:187-747(+)